MKTIKLAAVALLISGSTAFAQVITKNDLRSNTEVEVVVSEVKKVEIPQEEVPEAVLATLGNSEYAAWEIAKAYQVMDEETEEIFHYELRLMNESGEEATFEAKPDGTPLEEVEE